VQGAPVQGAPVQGAETGETQIDWGDLLQVVKYCEYLQGEGRLAMAIEAYRRFLAAHRGDLLHVGLFNLAVFQAQSGLSLEAEALMRHVLRLKVDSFHAHLNLGVLLESQGKQSDAVQVWAEALEVPGIDAPEQVENLTRIANNLGRLLEILRRYDEAEVALARSLKARAGQTAAIGHWLHLRQKMCRWPAAHGLGMPQKNVMEHASALAMMALTDDPQLQLDNARRFVRERVGRFSRMVPREHRYGHKRLRIGFLSSDLSMHAVSLLTVEMFEKFDRSRVELHAFCWSKEDGTSFRERVRAAFDHFHKVGGLSDEEVARLVVSQEIDVVFDLQGITSGARPDIVARGPAPLQIAYLGYVGTTALPHVDCVLADHFIFPEALRPFFSEEPIFLPVFQVSDSQRLMGDKASRSQYGLPEDAFVYCAFNNNFKITPEVFESWMRILREVPHAILWLLEDNVWSKENLQRAAVAHGVASDRLYFAQRIDPKDYLARFAVADLFLDTNPYGAGTTANDVLWAGLPILTRPGKTYVSRMAGALLHAAGLKELICDTPADYERRAIDLAHHLEPLATYRSHLQRLHPNKGIFDTGAITRHLEDELVRLVGGPGAVGRGNGMSNMIGAPLPLVRETGKLRVLLRGWRGYNHSYSLVNQYQLAVMSQMDDLELYFEDFPPLDFWTKEAIASDLPDWVRVPGDRIRSWYNQPVDVSYSITVPWTFFQGPSLGDFSFMVTEFKPKPERDFEFTQGMPAPFTSGKRRVITPSMWSKQQLIDVGLDGERIVVIPHGVDQKAYKPISDARRQRAREAIGIGEKNFALLNVGAPFFNKGLDLLIVAYAMLKKEAPELRLIVKDLRALYMKISDEMIARVHRSHPGLITEESLAGIIAISENLSTDQMVELYGAADLYVSPYRAEGFNLPVLEAMACGLPCIVTKGGATDDYFLPEAGWQLNAERTQAKPSMSDRLDGEYLEPDLDHLLQLIRSAMATERTRTRLSQLPSWESVTHLLVQQMKALKAENLAKSGSIKFCVG